MSKILLLLVIAGDPQIVKPMDSVADCVAAAELVTKVHDKMLWCGRGGCSGKDFQVTCWDPNTDSQAKAPAETKPYPP